MKNLNSQNKLQEVEEEIDRVERTIEYMKKNIDPKKVKPIKKNGVGRYGDVNQSLSAISTSFNFLYKTTELGKSSVKGTKFSDRKKIGRNPSRIVGIDLYENKGGIRNIVGIQTTYDISGVLKKSPLNMIHSEDEADRKAINLFDNEDYFNQIENH